MKSLHLSYRLQLAIFGTVVALYFPADKMYDCFQITLDISEFFIHLTFFIYSTCIISHFLQDTHTKWMNNNPFVYYPWQPQFVSQSIHHQLRTDMSDSQKVGDQKWDFSQKIQKTLQHSHLHYINYATLSLTCHINLNGFIIFYRLKKENSYAVNLCYSPKKNEFITSKNPIETVSKTLITSLTCKLLIEKFI